MSHSRIQEAPRPSSHGLPTTVTATWVRDALRFSVLHIVRGGRAPKSAICGANTRAAPALTAHELLQGKRCAECEAGLSAAAARD